jgi:5-methylcytosine-specific restriction endonuclease McrA
MSLQAGYGERTINEITLLFRNKQINLNPGFQRKSVWSQIDRRRLIQSIVSEYPLPNIFLYRRNVKGKTVYDVIDGKQRLETILMFMGFGQFKREQFDVRIELDNDGLCWWTWKDIKKYSDEVRHKFECSRLQTVEVSGELSEIVDLFVRINSTGKRLTSGEKRHARFYESRFLQEAEKLVRRNQSYLLKNSIMSQAQLGRMKGTELFSELLMSIHMGGLINKKTALDRAIGNDSVNGNTLRHISKEFTATINLIKKMYPELKQTRFRNTAEFYSLFMLVWQMQHDKLALREPKRNTMAFEMLRRLSTGVDQLREQYRRAKAAKPRPPYSDYLLTVQGDTDSLATRQRREKVLRALLLPIYEYKDNKRGFSAEQRRIIWNTDSQKKCIRCKRNLTWDDFTVDHIKAHVRGGKTRLDNAQLMCRSCNSRKGGR